MTVNCLAFDFGIENDQLVLGLKFFDDASADIFAIA
jgi:hypothetical protein